MGEQYPKWLTHQSGHALIAKDFDDHQMRRAEGYLTADEYDALCASAPPSTVEETIPSPGNEVTPQDAPTVLPFDMLSAKEAIARVNDTVAPEILAGWRLAEENRVGGPRKTVLNAMADKLGESVAADLPAAEPDQVGATLE